MSTSKIINASFDEENFAINLNWTIFFHGKSTK